MLLTNITIFVLQEEEQFANALIEEFEKGSIRDCENGCTLRAYLSKKLHCAPMRISKKYAGKSIGKHVFLSRISPMNGRNRMDANGIAGMDRSGCMNTMLTPFDKLRNLEFRFHMSLIQEGAACSVRHYSGNTDGKAIGNAINVNEHPTMNGSAPTNGAFPMIVPTPSSNVSKCVVISLIVLSKLL